MHLVPLPGTCWKDRLLILPSELKEERYQENSIFVDFPVLSKEARAVVYSATLKL